MPLCRFYKLGFRRTSTVSSVLFTLCYGYMNGVFSGGWRVATHGHMEVGYKKLSQFLSTRLVYKGRILDFAWIRVFQARYRSKFLRRGWLTRLLVIIVRWSFYHLNRVHSQRKKDANKVYYVNMKTVARNPHMAWWFKGDLNPLNSFLPQPVTCRWWRD